MSSTDEPAAVGDAAATLQLKTTAKWLIGASASTAALLVAGLQLTNLQKLGEADWWIGVLALTAALLALASVFRVLYQAASVLGTTRPPIATLADRDRADRGNPNGRRIEQPDDPLLKELIVQRRSELLGPRRDAIGSLTDDLTAASRSLATRATVTIQGRQYDPTVASDATALQELITELQRRISDVSDAAERFETTRNYASLKNQLALNGVFFLVGVLGFAWLTLLYPQRITPYPPVTAPVQIEVTVPSAKAAAQAGLEKTCAGKRLTGAAVGGTLDNPVIVTRAQKDCPAHRLTDPHGLVVIPAAAAR